MTEEGAVAQAESPACWQIVDPGLKLRVFKHGEVETFFLVSDQGECS